jgi:peptidoglycan/LPS O-acetylase OafA/YrhL
MLLPLSGGHMKTKSIQIFWLILATLFVAGILWFVKDPLTVTSISGTFTGIIGIFLGVDILTMIHKTKELKPGDFKAANTHRYVISLCIFAVLLAEAFVISGKYSREMNSLYLCFGVGFLITAGGLINGIECNKIATDEGPETE